MTNQQIDYHQEITKKERSSRYIRVAFDYFRERLGDEKYISFLHVINLSVDSSIYIHITNDENWNSYLLEIYILNKMLAYFEDKQKTIWDLGIASGSGTYDKKEYLYEFQIKVAPIKMLIARSTQMSKYISQISTTSANVFKSVTKNGKKTHRTEYQFNYDNLPKQLLKPLSSLKGYKECSSKLYRRYAVRYARVIYFHVL